MLLPGKSLEKTQFVMDADPTCPLYEQMYAKPWTIPKKIQWSEVLKHVFSDANVIKVLA
jgi:hypothetical protein